ncbi:MAG: hypothetical protein B9S32_09660 [Verrucomicrobia bacterium Tous-C9LFEB]|nr:MAG: hypothetical protein B9S32_09660 [Verrucomicrobia bacterium Tous-C9LFEB]
MSFILGLIFISITFAGIIICAEWLLRRFSMHPEIVRKLVHVTMGLALLPLPWLFAETWQGICMAVVGASLLWALYYIPFLKRWSVALNAVQRETAGHYYFVAGALATFLIAHEHKAGYVMAVLALSLADASAGLIGVLKGKFKCWGNDKTLEGSIAFSISSFLIAGFLLAQSEQYPVSYTLLLSLSIALSGMIVEALFIRGSDNLCIPIATYGVFQLGLTLNVWSLLFSNILVVTAIAAWIVKELRSQAVPSPTISNQPLPALRAYPLCSNSEVL